MAELTPDVLNVNYHEYNQRELADLIESYQKQQDLNDAEIKALSSKNKQYKTTADYNESWAKSKNCGSKSTAKRRNDCQHSIDPAISEAQALRAQIKINKNLIDIKLEENQIINSLLAVLTEAQSNVSTTVAEGYSQATVELGALGTSFSAVQAIADADAAARITESEADAKMKRGRAQTKNVILIISGIAAVALIGLFIYYKKIK